MQAKIALKLDNVEVINQRVEDYRPGDMKGKSTFDVIISHQGYFRQESL